jgi:hypothetical protein
VGLNAVHSRLEDAVSLEKFGGLIGLLEFLHP